MIYLKLFLAFMQIGFISFGGGYAALAPIQHQVIDINGWLSMTEFTDLITISQMTPGPIALNAATFVGLRVAGFPGAVAATLGNITPSLIIVLILAFIYYRYNNVTFIKNMLYGLRPTVVALIASAGLTIFFTALFGVPSIQLQSIDWINLGVFSVALVILRKYKVDPIIIMLGSGLIGVLLTIII